MELLPSVVVTLLFVSSPAVADPDRPCAAIKFDEDSVVCVCNGTYCDPFPALTRPLGDEVILVTSSRGGKRFSVSSARWEPESRDGARRVVLRRRVGVDTRQRIVGFGGAFTDAAGANINSLPADAQRQLLWSYFAEDGIRYTLGRIPIAGCDFSERPYTYDDVPGDETLANFSLTEEDAQMKIPYILEAMGMAGGGLRLLGSAWSAPAWMKTNNNITGLGWLKPEYYQLWADYHVRFLEEYAKEGVHVSGLTAQNEPTNGDLPPGPWNSMEWTAEKQRDWIRDNLGPTLRGHPDFGDTKIMILDDQRDYLPEWADTVLGDPAAAQYVDGIAVHWYRDLTTPAAVLEETHARHPDVPLIATEACEGSQAEKKVALGAWARAESYANDIIDDLNNWVTGWVDWNLALDTTGGPNWVGNFVDSPIIVDAENGRFFKQPMFYALGHFSALLPPGTAVISLEDLPGDGMVKATMGLTPDDLLVIVVLNKNHREADIGVKDPDRGTLDLKLPAKSITTIVYAAE